MINKQQLNRSSNQLSKLEALSNVSAVSKEAKEAHKVYLINLSIGMREDDSVKFGEFLDRYDTVIKVLYRRMNGNQNI